MLRKIDCVMLRVPDLSTAVEFYTRTFGLRPLWRDETSAGMGLPETDAEIVLHTMDLGVEYAVHYLVDDVAEAVATATAGTGVTRCVVQRPPFEVAVGLCAVLTDPFGNTICLLELTRRRDAGR